MNRIKTLRKAKKLSQTALASKLHVDTSAVSQWETEKTNPSFETAVKLASFFGVSVEYMMGLDAPGSDKAARIPVLGRVPAGIPFEAIEDVLDWEEIPAEQAKRGEYFALKVKGDSMEPRIYDGDVLIVRKQSTAESGNVVIALVNGDDATVKRFKRLEHGIMLLPNNPAYEPMVFTDEDVQKLPVEIIGVVVECRQKYNV